MHSQVQRSLELEKASAAASKARLKELGGVTGGATGGGGKEGGGGEAGVERGSSNSALAPSAADAVGGASAAVQEELSAAREQAVQLRNKLEHSQSERQRDRHKLERTLEEARGRNRHVTDM